MIPAAHSADCGVCRRALGTPPSGPAAAASGGVLGCARCPRAFHERCLGLRSVDHRGDRFRSTLPWVDARGYWLCAACEGAPDSKGGLLDAASSRALAEIRRAAPPATDGGGGVMSLPATARHARARGALAGAKSVLDVLAGHDFARSFPGLAAVVAACAAAVEFDAAAGPPPGDGANRDPVAAADAWSAAAAASTAAAASAVMRARAALRDAKAAPGATPATAKKARELGTLAELGFARAVRPNLPKDDQRALDDHQRESAGVEI